MIDFDDFDDTYGGTTASSKKINDAISELQTQVSTLTNELASTNETVADNKTSTDNSINTVDGKVTALQNLTTGYETEFESETIKAKEVLVSGKDAQITTTKLIATDINASDVSVSGELDTRDVTTTGDINASGNINSAGVTTSKATINDLTVSEKITFEDGVEFSGTDITFDNVTAKKLASPDANITSITGNESTVARNNVQLVTVADSGEWRGYVGSKVYDTDLWELVFPKYNGVVNVIEKEGLWSINIIDNNLVSFTQKNYYIYRIEIDDSATYVYFYNFDENTKYKEAFTGYKSYTISSNYIIRRGSIESNVSKLYGTYSREGIKSTENTNDFDIIYLDALPISQFQKNTIYVVKDRGAYIYDTDHGSSESNYLIPFGLPYIKESGKYYETKEDGLLQSRSKVDITTTGNVEGTDALITADTLVNYNGENKVVTYDTVQAVKIKSYVVTADFNNGTDVIHALSYNNTWYVANADTTTRSYVIDSEGYVGSSQQDLLIATKASPEDYFDYNATANSYTLHSDVTKVFTADQIENKNNAVYDYTITYGKLHSGTETYEYNITKLGDVTEGTWHAGEVDATALKIGGVNVLTKFATRLGKDDIVNNLTSTDTDKVLSALQGNVLDQKKFDIEQNVSNNGKYLMVVPSETESGFTVGYGDIGNGVLIEDVDTLPGDTGLASTIYVAGRYIEVTEE